MYTLSCYLRSFATVSPLATFTYLLTFHGAESIPFALQFQSKQSRSWPFVLMKVALTKDPITLSEFSLLKMSECGSVETVRQMCILLDTTVETVRQVGREGYKKAQ